MWFALLLSGYSPIWSPISIMSINIFKHSTYTVVECTTQPINWLSNTRDNRLKTLHPLVICIFTSCPTYRIMVFCPYNKCFPGNGTLMRGAYIECSASYATHAAPKCFFIQNVIEVRTMMCLVRCFRCRYVPLLVKNETVEYSHVWRLSNTSTKLKPVLEVMMYRL